MRTKVIELIGVPMDLGAGRRGVDMGPSAFRIAHIVERIEALGCEVHELGDIDVPIPEMRPAGDDRARYLEEIAGVCEALYERVGESLASACLPIVLGGDHSLAVGSVAGSAAAARAAGVPLGLIWVDAHADMNTPDSSPSGNVHGMPLAACLGRGPRELTAIGGAQPSVTPERTVLLGIRNLDETEKQLVRDSGVHAFTMTEIDQRGLFPVLREALDIATAGGARLHLSFDLDSVDPAIAPGVGTPVRGGLSYREAHLIMETAAECGALTTLDLVEVNPILDTRNATAELAVELALSAIGQRIL
jgi:arginase